MSDDKPPDNVLFDWYRRYIGEPEGEMDVYLGFGLFFGGIALAGLALVLFFWSATLEYGTNPFWAIRRPAFALGLLALPSAMVGIVVLLPVDRRVRVAAFGGSLVALVAVVAFVNVYPNDFNVQSGADYSAQVTAVYAIGLALDVASTGAALVGFQLERIRAPGPGDIQPREAEEDESGPTYTDEEIQRDIDAAMEGVELSWGGVEKHEGRDLQFSVDEEFERVSFADVEAKTTRSSGIDDQLSKLKGLRGGQAQTAKSHSTVDDQTAKLRELREQQRSEREKKEREVASGGLLGRVKGLFR